MQDGFVRVMTAVPEIRVADARHNAGASVELARKAAAEEAALVVFPELGLVGRSCADLFFQQTLLENAESALAEFARATAALHPVFVVGLPWRHGAALYNVAAVIQRGRVLGLVPKTAPAAHGPDADARWFSPGPALAAARFGGDTVALGWRQLFCARGAECDEFVLGVEVGDDPMRPDAGSFGLAAAGAVVVANPAASAEGAGRAGFRRRFVVEHSARLACAVVRVEAGAGESSTDAVFGGQQIVAENGALLAEVKPFAAGVAVADIDVQRLAFERRRLGLFCPRARARAGGFGGEGGSGSGFADAPGECVVPVFNPRDAAAGRAAAPAGIASAAACGAWRVVEFNAEPTLSAPLRRPLAAHPFVPADAGERDERCREVFAIQAAGLAQRLRRAGARAALVGLSGGLDSTLAFLVSLAAAQRLGWPPERVLAVVMPGPGSTPRTQANAEALAGAYGASRRTIDIGPALERHFEDIGQDPAVHDAAYENSQARERTQILMDLANRVGGLVVGTGDLSELALGWTTYNGDHISMYGVNASVPKTLVRHLVAWSRDAAPDAARPALDDILDTPVSPELLPPKCGPGGAEISQCTEAIVGPYELHDFFLYYALRWGFRPRKAARLAEQVFAGRYGEDDISHWLRVFYRRFFAQQFKRSCMPDGPATGSVTLSPRGGWMCPSDAEARLWLEDIEGGGDDNDEPIWPDAPLAASLSSLPFAPP